MNRQLPQTQNKTFVYSYDGNGNILSKKEYPYTTNGEAPSYINNQNDNNVKNIKWGLSGNTGANGCGWIAVYNVMLSYSKKITYQYVINGLTSAGGVLGFGKLGADPRGITKYLKSKFWFVYTAGPIIYLWGIKSELSGGIIVLYQHKGWNSSLHYIAGIKEGMRGRALFCFHNSDVYDSRHVTIDNRLMSFQTFVDYVYQQKASIITIIVVRQKIGRW